MQIVSDKWKQAHKKTLLNESFVEVSLDIGDPEARDNASSEDNGAIYISDSSQLTNSVDKAPTPYCTLEQNLWCLDGKRKAIPESDFGDTSFISDVLSDENCNFSAKLPIITIQFERVFSKLIPGITILWSDIYGECADTFTVIAYNDDVVVAEKQVVGNKSVKSLILTKIVNYNRIVIIVEKWCLPHHRARVEEIVVGLRKVYGKGELFDYSHRQTADPLSTSLPKVEIKFSISNIDDEYNPYNTEGLSQYLMERQEVKARYGMKMDDNTIEWIPGGTFYLSEWYAKQNGITADFTARDLLEFMSEKYVETKADVYWRSLGWLANDVLKRANIPGHTESTPKWVIDESLYDDLKMMTSAPLPEDTLANCLQLIANAGECTIYQDREGILHIEPLKYTDTDYVINSFNSYTKSEMTLTKPIKQIKVKHYHYISGEVDWTEEIIYPENGDVLNPVGEIITVDNPLITSADRALSVAKWMVTHLGHRMALDSTWRADVRLDALDIVTNTNSYNSNKVRMTEVEFKFNGALRGTGKGKVISDG